MNNRRIYILIGISVLTVIAAVAVVAAVLGLGTIIRRNQILEEFAPPVVIISSPSPGSTYPVGMNVLVSASALGFQPITRVELWLDGILQETQTSNQPDGTTPFFSSFVIPVPDGAHNITVRAINFKGIVGQSIPLNIFGTPTDENEILSYVFPAEEDETVEDLGEKTGLDPKDILAANPALAGGVPPGGMNVVVPVPEGGIKQEVKTKTPPQNQPAPNPNPGGTNLKVSLIPGFGFIVESPPAAPDKLKAEGENCWINIQWMDNANNESGYRVWRSSPGSFPTKIVELNPLQGIGTAKYKFAVPFPGIFNIWVEAVNQGGAQPSNTITINIIQNCSANSSDYFQLEITELREPYQVGKDYCYLSINNAADIRLPKDEKSFLKPISGKLDMTGWAAGTNKIVLPKPLPYLHIDLECWGWIGGQLSQIGDISQDIDKGTWDGRQQTLKTTGTPTLEIDVSVKPLNAEWKPSIATGNSSSIIGRIPLIIQGAFNHDPSVAVPYNVRLERYGSDDANASDAAVYEWFWERTLKWDWKGDSTKINGFAIYLDGVPYMKVEGANKRETQVKLPSTCGMNLRWQVAAVSSQAQSALSVSVDEQLPKCNTYVVVKFDTYLASCISDGWEPYCSSGHDVRSTADLYYTLSAGSISKPFYGGNFFYPLSPGRHHFNSIGQLYVTSGKYPSADTFVIPISTQIIDFTVAAELWDYDPYSPNDLLFRYKKNWYFHSRDDLIDYINEEGNSQDCTIAYEYRSTTDDAIGTLTYTVEVIPNSCRDTP